MKTERHSTGIAGIDEIVHGGLTSGRVYMIRGSPGTGKTTFGFHFVSSRPDSHGRSLFVTFGHAAPWIRRDAEAMGFDLREVEFLDLSPKAEVFTESKGYEVFPPSDIELPAITRMFVQAVERIRPERIFIDAITQLQIMSSDAPQFRSQVGALFRYAKDQGVTLLFSSEPSPQHPDEELQHACDGIILMENCLSLGRSVQITKLLGSAYLEGRHGVRISEDGLHVFPRLVPSEHRAAFAHDLLQSGIPELDTLLHGGVVRGTVVLISGPSGAGKTTLGCQFLAAAAGRGERSMICLFEEAKESLLLRSQALKIPLRKMIHEGSLQLLEIEPVIYSADEFTNILRKEVEQSGIKTILIDSLEGFRIALRGEDFVKSIRALWRYLANMGVTLFVTSEIENIAGEFKATEHGISYLADDIIFLRYIEKNGELRRSIGVLKKRLSDFEKSLREIEFTDDGIKIGAPLREISTLLRGIPSIPSRRAA